jgi:hypothetical protein
MKHEYNPKNFLRIASPDLLQTYFEQRRLLGSYNWEICDADSLFAALSDVPADERQAVSVDFQNVFTLACKKGIATLLDAGKAKEVDLAGVEMGRATIDKVLRVLIDHPAVFQTGVQLRLGRWTPPLLVPTLRFPAAARAFGSSLDRGTPTCSVRILLDQRGPRRILPGRSV